MLKSINLSLSAICSADCIYCPSDRGKNLKQKIMPFEYAKKIIDEISSEKFRKIHSVENIELGENGDAFLNKDFIKIARYIRKKLPKIRVELYTNFNNFTKDKAEIILKEKLIDSFVCNIDGSNEENFFAVKKLSLSKVMENLKGFLEIRKELNSSTHLTIRVLTLNNYIHTIRNNLGFLPSKLKDEDLVKTKDDFQEIKEQLEKILDMKRDLIVESGAIAWAERESSGKVDYSKYSCPYIRRILTEAFIAADGSWYACCVDSSNRLIIGNVVESSINELCFSKRRKELVKLLANRQFGLIGGPCKTVNCCQWYMNNKKNKIKK